MGNPTLELSIRMGNCLAMLIKSAEPAAADERAQWREVRHSVRLAREAIKQGDLRGAEQELFAASAEADECEAFPPLLLAEINMLWLATRELRRRLQGATPAPTSEKVQ